MDKVKTLAADLTTCEETMMDSYSKGLVDGFTKQQLNSLSFPVRAPHQHNQLSYHTNPGRKRISAVCLSVLGKAFLPQSRVRFKGWCALKSLL